MAMAYGVPVEPDLEDNVEQELAASEQRSDAAGEEERLDFFIKRDGVEFAGTHLIIDLWDVSRIDDPAHIENREAPTKSIDGPDGDAYHQSWPQELEITAPARRKT